MAGGHCGNESSMATSGPIQQTVQPVSAYLLYRGDNTSLQFLGQKLDAMVPGCEIGDKGRGKLGHLTGATKKPPEDDPTFQN